MKKNERMELAQWAMEHALKNGADQAAITLSNNREIQIKYRDSKLEELKESAQNSLSLDIYIDHRFSGHTTNKINKDSLGKFIEEAVASTKYLTKDQYRSLPDPMYYPEDTHIDLKIYDSSHDEIDSSNRVKIASEIESIAMAQSDRIISTTSSYSDTREETVKAHSNGFAGEKESTSYWAGAEVTMEGKDGDRPADWFYAGARFHKELPGPEILAKRAVNFASRKIGQEKVKSGRYDTIIENRAGNRLIHMLLKPMRGRALQQKNSFLEGMIGKKIASDNFTMIDEPFIEKGLGSRHFDKEGLAAERRVMIENGILRHYYIDDYYGKKLGMEPTSGTSSNIVFEYGSRSLEEMIKNMQSGIFVTGFIGGNSNSTTGDFSFGLVGQMIEKGEIVKPINEMNISGNSNEFWNRLVEMGNDPYPYSSTRRPSMFFEDVNFSGL
jgi:PmbA protein